MARLWLALAALMGLAFVALLALAAHGPQMLAALLGLPLPEMAGGPPPRAEAGLVRFSALEQALLLHGFHALALGLVALWIDRRGGVFANLAALGMVAGTWLFCWPIWARALGQEVPPGLTPLGGSLLLGAWAVFALSALFGGASARRTADRTAPAASPPPAARGWPTRPAPPAAESATTTPLPVEERHPPPAEPRPAVSGAPRKPAVSR
jgi:uncharacterized membrane protein YgdD (TMEM256/DUF423 family)